MKLLALALTVALSGCAGATSSLIAADAATALIVGERLTMARHGAGDASSDPLVILTLTHADGRMMTFEQANHAPLDLAAQTAGGPLAQAMGLFGGEAPTLYRPRDAASPFICAPDGPVALGVHRAANGDVAIVGLRQNFEFEQSGEGFEALPFSPDMVCARLRLRKS